jgi:hypothetical protein
MCDTGQSTRGTAADVTVPAITGFVSGVSLGRLSSTSSTSSDFLRRRTSRATLCFVLAETLCHRGRSEQLMGEGKGRLAGEKTDTMRTGNQRRWPASVHGCGLQVEATTASLCRFTLLQI